MNFLKDLNDQETQQLLSESKDILILDVRTPEEVAEGKLPGAINIPLNKLSTEVDEILDYQDKDVLVYCRAGHRSVTACMMLEHVGFDRLYNLDCGIIGYTGEIVK